MAKEDTLVVSVVEDPDQPKSATTATERTALREKSQRLKSSQAKTHNKHPSEVAKVPEEATVVSSAEKVSRDLHAPEVKDRETTHPETTRTTKTVNQENLDPIDLTTPIDSAITTGLPVNDVKAMVSSEEATEATEATVETVAMAAEVAPIIAVAKATVVATTIVTVKANVAATVVEEKAAVVATSIATVRATVAVTPMALHVATEVATEEEPARLLQATEPKTDAIS
jgi:hypothetical protein